MLLLPKAEVEKRLDQKTEANMLLAAKINGKISTIHQEFNDLTMRINGEKEQLLADFATFSESLTQKRNSLLQEIVTLEAKKEVLLRPLTAREVACTAHEMELQVKETALKNEQKRVKEAEEKLRSKEALIEEQEKEIKSKKDAILELEKQVKHDDDLLTEAWSEYDKFKTLLDTGLADLEKREAQFEYNVKAQESMVKAMVKANEEEAEKIAVSRERLASDYEALKQAKREILK